MCHECLPTVSFLLVKIPSLVVSAWLRKDAAALCAVSAYEEFVSRDPLLSFPKRVIERCCSVKSVVNVEFAVSAAAAA